MKVVEVDRIDPGIARIRPKQKLKLDDKPISRRRVIDIVLVPHPGRRIMSINRVHGRVVDHHANEPRVGIGEEGRKRQLGRHVGRGVDGGADDPRADPHLGRDGRRPGVHLEGLGARVPRRDDTGARGRVRDLDRPVGQAALEVAVGDEAEGRAGGRCRRGRAGRPAAARRQVPGRGGAAGGRCAGRVVGSGRAAGSYRGTEGACGGPCCC